MPTLKHVQQLIQYGDNALSIDLQDAYLHIPIVEHHHHFLHFVWHNVPYQWKVLSFGLATAPRVFMSLPKPILFLCHCKGLHIVIYLDDSLVLICSKWVGKRAHLFFSSLLVCLELHINFFKSDLCLSQTFTFLGLCLDTVLMSVSFPPDKLAGILQLALSLLWTPHVTVHRVMSFLSKANFVPMAIPNCDAYAMSFRVTCYMFIILPHNYFLCSFFPFLLMSTGTVSSFTTEPGSFAISTS